MSGRENLEVEEAGSWGEEDEFYCFVDTQDGKQVLTVSYDFDPTRTAATEEAELSRLADALGSVALHGGDMPGGGYAQSGGSGVSAAEWWSGSQLLAVTLERPPQP